MYLKKTVLLSFCLYYNFLNCNGCNNENNDKEIFEIVFDKFCEQNKDYENICKILKPVLIVIDYFLFF